VIVKGNKLLGSGYHKQYGAAHAEINAINNAKRKGNNIIGSTLYVNLEPCFHYGKTPPCVDSIIQNKFSRVVVSSADPNSLVNGKSLQKLRRHHISVTSNILKEEARQLNCFFFNRMEKQRPFIALKYAETADGFIAKPNGSSQWITNEDSRKYVHHLRSQYDAILVGVNTVIQDNPELTVRHTKGKNPIRIILDKDLRSPLRRKIFQSDVASTIVFIARKTAEKKKQKIQQLKNKGVIVISVSLKKNLLDLSAILKSLLEYNISSIFVEGGARVFYSFLTANLVDYIYYFKANTIYFQSGMKGVSALITDKKFKKVQNKKFGNDELQEYLTR
ncbi:MAG: bifunctional diaminohydroxyphosphoribosylaminopyrimidine deaminase/5-amino-6-(5-phosphoribosylamino)uracil reductase RibD, partial [Bacteroidetes bacterium]|nr:bifunctional diaminohydroxyphosphoribosylaminopyrimidine deaminase/5-amino-6-(5-phosphoribosylamino)uracil reductase RibD [Bacteroidota bacterium]